MWVISHNANKSAVQTKYLLDYYSTDVKDGRGGNADVICIQEPRYGYLKQVPSTTNKEGVTVKGFTYQS